MCGGGRGAERGGEWNSRGPQRYGKVADECGKGGKHVVGCFPRRVSTKGGKTAGKDSGQVAGPETERTGRRGSIPKGNEREARQGGRRGDGKEEASQ